MIKQNISKQINKFLNMTVVIICIFLYTNCSSVEQKATQPLTVEYSFAYKNSKLYRMNLNLGNKVLAGRYKDPKRYTAGMNIVIFKNRRYKIIFWCDLCIEKTVENGEWNIKDNYLILNARFPDDYNMYLKKSYGEYRKLIFLKYVSSGEEKYILITKESLDELKKDDYYFSRYWEKTAPLNFCTPDTFI
ncbi:MAG: hypothetical protein GY749_03865 [Desulfobacteraceae bacterium]|nr:hypothetical protein [Desulfobacteraceae bacterium]